MPGRYGAVPESRCRVGVVFGVDEYYLVVDFAVHYRFALSCGLWVYVDADVVNRFLGCLVDCDVVAGWFGFCCEFVEDSPYLVPRIVAHWSALPSPSVGSTGIQSDTYRWTGVPSSPAPTSVSARLR